MVFNLTGRRDADKPPASSMIFRAAEYKASFSLKIVTPRQFLERGLEK